MGEKLRREVESQLLDDFKFYGIYNNNLKFDWSDSCIEGHQVNYLDGSIENFSGIMVFNEKNKLIAEGWMEFIYEKVRNIFIVYWDFLDVFINGEEIVKKKNTGIPEHILKLLPTDLRYKYKDF